MDYQIGPGPAFRIGKGVVGLFGTIAGINGRMAQLASAMAWQNDKLLTLEKNLAEISGTLMKLPELVELEVRRHLEARSR